MTINSLQARNDKNGARKTEFLGLAFDDFSQDQALKRIGQLLQKSGFSYLVTPNVDHMVAFNKTANTAMVVAYRHADLVLCDSRILSKLAQWSGVKLGAVPGSDLTRMLLQTEISNRRCAVIGGDAALHARIGRIYPMFDWTFYGPPMGVLHDPLARLKIAEFVENSSASIIFFAIGAPQSEITCYEIALRGRATGVALCIGASLEFLTGAKKRAPYWMQRSALEWLYRLGTEPGRLWRRYLLEGPQIFTIWRRWHKVTAARRRVESGSTPFDG